MTTIALLFEAMNLMINGGGGGDGDGDEDEDEEEVDFKDAILCDCYETVTKE